MTSSVDLSRSTTYRLQYTINSPTSGPLSSASSDTLLVPSDFDDGVVDLTYDERQPETSPAAWLIG